MNTRRFSCQLWGRLLRVVLLVIFVLAFTFGGQAFSRAQAAASPGFAAQNGDDPGAPATLLATQRTLSFPANALNFDKTSATLSQRVNGILWSASYVGGAFLTLPRPVDWDGTSDVTLRLFFYPLTGTAGAVDFFIRPRAYDAGDLFADAASMDGVGVPVSTAWQVREQVFTIPAAKFGSKALWVISMQRGGGAETYPSPVVLTSVGLTYTIAPAARAVLGFPANALNFDKNSTVLTQYGSGILWQSDYRNPAELSLPRPPGWDGTSDVTLRLFFYPLTGTAGAVDFFIRPRAFNPGDIYGDAADMNSSPVAVSAERQIRQQVFNIPAARFGSKVQWSILIQREGSGETYPGDVVLMAASLEYNHPGPQPDLLQFPANALNYDKMATIVSQFASGIWWQASHQADAVLSLPRPAGYDGTSPVALRVSFFPMTVPASDARVAFFIRPRAYDPGAIYGDAASVSSPAAAVTAIRQVQEQLFIIPASRLGDRAQWVVSLQRGGTGDTFAGDVIMTSVSLAPLTEQVFLPGVLK